MIKILILTLAMIFNTLFGMDNAFNRNKIRFTNKVKRMKDKLDKMDKMLKEIK